MYRTITSTRKTEIIFIVVTLIAGLIATAAPAQAGGATLPPGGTFTDDNGNAHEGFIEAIAAEGITQGCDQAGTLYCPSDFVNRGQMATFIARALELPDATGDHFDDDDGTTHEGNINKIFEAGVTAGFPDGTYRPDGLVRRDQMASFLARGIELNAPTGDYFDDDEGNIHEDNINAMAENSITLGCDAAGTMYCPDDNVRRDQMASFIGRALDLEEMVPPPPIVVDNSVDVFNFGFDPNPFVIDGTAGWVVFQVTEGTHRMVEGTPSAPVSGGFDTENLSEGDTSNLIFLLATGATTIQYFCSIHPTTMQGEIQITG